MNAAFAGSLLLASQSPSMMLLSLPPSSFVPTRTNHHISRKRKPPPAFLHTKVAMRFANIVARAAESDVVYDDGENQSCKFGKKRHWDIMYETGHDDDNRSSVSYSWYCNWSDIEPFWNDLISELPLFSQNANPHVLIPGIGNDPTPLAMYVQCWLCANDSIRLFF